MRGIDSIDLMVRSNNKASIIQSYWNFNVMIVFGGDDSDEVIFKDTKEQENIITVNLNSEETGAKYYVTDLKEVKELKKNMGNKLIKR